MSTRSEKTRAAECGMDAETWRDAKEQSRSSRTRGKAKRTRPESSLCDPVAGQLDLFSDLDAEGENDG